MRSKMMSVGWLGMLLGSVVWADAVMLLPAGFGDRSLRLELGTPPDAEWTGAQWLAAGEAGVWVLDLEERRVLAFGPEETRSVDATGVEGSGTVTTVQRARLAQLEAVALPAEASTRRLRVAPASDTEVWLVDGEQRRAWHLDPQSRRWSQPLQLGEAITAVAAAPSGELVVVTPEHPQSSFAVYDRNRSLVRRFGARLAAPHQSLEAPFNDWVVHATRKGELVAAHRFLPLVRRYDRRGTLRREKVLSIPQMASLEEARAQIEHQLEQGANSCVSCRLTHYATGIAALPSSGVAIGFGPRAAITVLDEAGRETETLLIDDGRTSWQHAGFAVDTDLLISREQDGVVVRAAAPRTFELTGTVHDTDGPIAGASIQLLIHHGILAKTTTNEEGRFRFPQKLPLEAHGQLSAEAEGYLRTRIEGLLRSLVAEPVVMQPAPRICARVFERASGAPVERFDLLLVRELITDSGAVLEWSDAESVSAPGGLTCHWPRWELPVVVQVLAEGFAPARVRVGADHEAPIEIALDPEARLRVQVVSHRSSEPVEGARVSLRPSDAPSQTVEHHLQAGLEPALEGQTDLSGLAVLTGLTPGEFVLEVTAPGFLRTRIELELESGEIDREVTLSPGIEVQVLVMVEGSRAPLPDAQVSIEPVAASAGSRLVCTTRAEGRCEIAGVAAGPHSVIATAEGYSRRRIPRSFAGDSAESTLEITLPPASSLAGVVDGIEAYSPLEFQLLVSAAGGGPSPHPLGVDGHFHFADIPVGAVSLFVTDRTTRSAYAKRDVVVPAGGLRDIHIELPPPLRLGGTVTVAEARPCGGCSVTLQRIGAEAGGLRLAAPTGPDGRYELALPSPGMYQVVVADRASSASLTDHLEIWGSRSADWQLGGAVLVGAVSRSDGEGAGGATLHVTDVDGRVVASGLAGDAGDFLLTDLQSGSRVVVAELDGSVARQAVELHQGKESRVELLLPRSSTIRVRLRDQDGRQLLDSATVTVVGGNGQVIPSRRAHADSSGWITIPSEPDGAVTAVIQAPGHAVQTLRGLVPGSDLEVLVPLPRAFDIEVAPTVEPCAIGVRDHQGSWLALSATMPPGPVPFTVRAALFNSLPPGDYQVLVRACTGDWLDQPARLAPGSIPLLRFGFLE